MDISVVASYERSRTVGGDGLNMRRNDSVIISFACCALVMAMPSSAHAGVSCAKNLDTKALPVEKKRLLESACSAYQKSKKTFQELASSYRDQPDAYEVILRRERHLEEFIESSRTIDEFLSWNREQADFHKDMYNKIMGK